MKHEVRSERSVMRNAQELSVIGTNLDIYFTKKINGTTYLMSQNKEDRKGKESEKDTFGLTSRRTFWNNHYNIMT